jgi:uncharacterized membrane protein
MMGWSGWSTAGGITMTVGMIALAALAVAGVFLPVFSREVRAPNVPTVEGIGEESGGLRLLAERYARGEIDREEFLERRQYLAGHSR